MVKRIVDTAFLNFSSWCFEVFEFYAKKLISSLHFASAGFSVGVWALNPGPHSFSIAPKGKHNWLENQKSNPKPKWTETKCWKPMRYKISHKYLWIILWTETKGRNNLWIILWTALIQWKFLNPRWNRGEKQIFILNKTELGLNILEVVTVLACFGIFKP